MIAAISGGEGSGLLALLIHRAVASLTGGLGFVLFASAWLGFKINSWWLVLGFGVECDDSKKRCLAFHPDAYEPLSPNHVPVLISIPSSPCPASPPGREAVPAPYSQPFVEALLSMVGGLVTSTSGEHCLICDVPLLVAKTMLLARKFGLLQTPEHPGIVTLSLSCHYCI